MRKPLVIGAIAALVIGVTAKVLSEWEPKPGTVAWHKQEYLANRFPITAIDRIQDKWSRLRSQTPPKNLSLLELGTYQAHDHARALEKLGYLRRRPLALTNTLGLERADVRLWRQAEKKLPNPHIWWIDYEGQNMFLLYERRDAARWEKLIAEVNAQSK